MNVITQALFGLAVAAAIFVPLERLTRLRKDQRIFRAAWRADALHFTVTSFVARVGVIAAVVVPVVILRLTVAPFTAPVLGSLPSWGQLLAAIVVVEFLAYFAHRAAHTVPFLWRFHRVHHSSEELDWLASARLHPIDSIWTRGVAIIGLASPGFTGEVFVLYLTLTIVQAVFIHSNTRLRFGSLRWVVGTPEWHHWHHAADAEAINCNFAGQLPVIDVLFGTAHMPAGRRPRAYGLSASEPPMPRGWLGQMAAPFRRTVPVASGPWPLATQETPTSSR